MTQSTLLQILEEQKYSTQRYKNQLSLTKKILRNLNSDPVVSKESTDITSKIKEIMQKGKYTIGTRSPSIVYPSSVLSSIKKHSYILDSAGKEGQESLEGNGGLKSYFRGLESSTKKKKSPKLPPQTSVKKSQGSMISDRNLSSARKNRQDSSIMGESSIQDYPDFTLDSPRSKINISSRIIDENIPSTVSKNARYQLQDVRIEDVIGARSNPISLMGDSSMVITETPTKQQSRE